MEDSILNTIKKLLNIDTDETAFDADIIVNINSNLMTLTQLGVGTPGFNIEDASSTWSEFTDLVDILPQIKSYVHLKTKLVFDPPQSSVIVEVYKSMLTEIEQRILIRLEAE